MQAQTPGSPRRRFLFRELERKRDAISNLTPNWFASVMGTGIVAVAAATLPFQPPGMRQAASAAWLLAAGLLALLVIASAAHVLRHPRQFRANLTNPVMVNFTGAIAMAFLTAGHGALLYAPAFIGPAAAIGLDIALWSIGTGIGIVTAVSVPAFLFLRETAPGEGGVFGGWLMPVVPPMVSASTGASIVQHLPAGEARVTMLIACAMLFGATIIPSLLITGQLWARLARHGIGPAAMVPTLWIVLGPLGQSSTAAMALGRASAHVLPEEAASTAAVLGVAYAAPVMGTALLWMGIVVVITIRQIRRGMPFALSWWSFTFPVGTCVTGASGLAAASGSTAVAVLATVIYAGLITAWAIVFARTAHGALRTGRLLAPPPPS